MNLLKCFAIVPPHNTEDETMYPTTTERLYAAFRWKESAIECNIMDAVRIWEIEISDLVGYLETDVSLSDKHP